MNKYKNIFTEIDGIKFHSKKEAARYVNLKILDKAGEIRELDMQVRYTINVGTMKVCTYIADFTYIDKYGTKIVEDVKGIRTAIYKLKAKLMLAVYGIKILET